MLCQSPAVALLLRGGAGAGGGGIGVCFIDDARCFLFFPSWYDIVFVPVVPDIQRDFLGGDDGAGSHGTGDERMAVPQQASHPSLVSCHSG